MDGSGGLNVGEKILITTVTGDYYQPVRLHYQVFHQRTLLRVFKKLRCVEHDPGQQRWVWLYEYEARSLQFKHSYAQILHTQRPIVHGSFFQRSKDKLLLDLRSHER